MSDSNAQSGGIGVTGLLGVAFIVLKLTHVIDWPWKWVLAPFWVPFVVVLGIGIPIILGYVIYKAWAK